jgi:hypothetical protein
MIKVSPKLLIMACHMQEKGQLVAKASTTLSQPTISASEINMIKQNDN